ncbi:MAG: Uma2 family endonuclease [Ignavibacteriae bacterium]|nr:Uma2 family endonuclease [Ignavibacteriota bacterium]
MEWAEVIRNPLLRNLPFKIELTKYGQLLMSPASNKHGMTQGDTIAEIRKRRKSGRVIAECSIQTSDGVKVADVAWASDEFLKKFGDETPYPQSPELCIEIISPSNSKEEIAQKIDLYFARGAAEVWTISEDRKVQYYRAGLPVKRSDIVPKFGL